MDRLGLERLAELLRLVVFPLCDRSLRLGVLAEPEEPFRERALLRLRVEAPVFDFAAVFDLAAGFEREALLPLLCPPLDADSLAIRSSLSEIEATVTRGRLPHRRRINRVCRKIFNNWPCWVSQRHRAPTERTDNMSETTTRDAKLIELLNEAYTKEKQLETALAAHVEMTTRKDYAKRLKDHLKETKSHASQVSKRIKQLGGSPETVSMPGPDGLHKAAESVADVVGRAKAAAQGPLHTVRGSGEQEKMLRNARTQYQEEAHEIATYTVIDSVAAAVGDKQTAKLARDILRQEERMQEFLAGLLPELSADVVHDEIPVSEIDGPATRRTAADSKPKRSRANSSKSSSSGSKSSSSRSKSSSSGSKSSSSRSKSSSAKTKSSSSKAKASRSRAKK